MHDALYIVALHLHCTEGQASSAELKCPFCLTKVHNVLSVFTKTQLYKDVLL